MIPVGFEYHSPASVQEAVKLLSTLGEDVKILGGGQSLVTLMKLRLARPKHLIDLSSIPGLSYIRDEGNHLLIGALTTHTEIEESDLLKRKTPLLPLAATAIGDVQVRNRGTFGGSIAHSDPTGDIPPCILALDAEIKAVGPSGERWIKARDFFIGMLTTDLGPDEILTEIKIPAQTSWKCAYLKAAQRASGFAVVGVAACLQLDNDGTCREIAVALTGVTEKAYRAANVEDKLRAQKLDSKLIEDAASVVVDGIDVNEDINGSQEYRSHLARVYTARAVEAALKT
ncbi:MAG: FAD binding domain-containing protein [Candidatus Binatia bacterium]